MKTKSIVFAIATIAFLGLTSFVLKENISNDSSQKNTIVSSDEDEVIYSNKKIFTLTVCTGHAYIIADILKTPSGRFYANMKYPEEKNRMTIYKLNSRDNNAYIEYDDCAYAFYLNDSRW